MNLGFELGVTNISRRGDSLPWWYSYAAISGALPDLVLEGEGGRLHGATALNGWTIDLTGLDLSSGFTLHARGHLDYAGEPATFPRLVEVGTDGDPSNRQSLMIQKSTSQVRVISRQSDVVRFSASFPDPTVSTGSPFESTIRFAPHDFAAAMPGAITQFDTAGGVPAGLNRLFLRSAAGEPPVSGRVDLVVLWASALADTDLENYAP